MTQRITPNIWCDRTAEQAGAFYASVFDDTTSRVTARYPSEGLPEFQRDFAGEAVMVDVVLRGYRFSLINADATFAPNPSISFLVTADPRDFDGDEHAARGWINRIWTALAEEGRVLMDIGEYPYSGLYGWVEDKFGMSWQLKLAAAGADPVPPVVPMLMFGDGVQNRAAEAVELYTGLFPDAGVGRVVTYPVTTSAEPVGAVMYADFRLAGQTFAVMDSQMDQDFTFTPGVSLLVDCEGQDEIDRLWDALTAVPEAEQCGWLADRFGVSWQIVPANMAELMQRPNAYAHMMAMKKLIIADF